MFEKLEGEECITAKGRKARCEPGSLGGKLTATPPLSVLL